jgi:TolB-like protein/class 3 adenylate cyclase
MITMRAERRLSAIMAADIVGYSRLIESDEAVTLKAIKALRVEVIDPLIAEHKGRIVKLMGDGALVEYQSVVDAVVCAVAIQTGITSYQVNTPPERRIVFRIGINLGDVVVEGDDLLGDGVNVASRLEQLCPAGGVLISGTAYDHMKGKLGLPLDYTGEQQVKNISEPVRTYSVRMEGVKRGWRLRTRRFRRWRPIAAVLLPMLILVGVGIWWFQPVDTTMAKPAIAVLPFDNLGGDEATGRLAGGITEDIITDLARYREADVIARNSTAVYQGKPVDVRQVGRDLKVRYVLQGSVQRQGDQIRITAQLIDVRSNAHLWSDRWDRPVTDLFAVQTEISEQVTNRLLDSGGAILGSEHVAGRRTNPRDLTAYELYLRGREAMYQFTKESVTEALSMLKLAVEKDPTLARAWVELAGAHNSLVDFGAEPGSARTDALKAAERAVALDPMDALAHAQLAHLTGMLGDIQRSKAEFETALRLNPGSADVMTTYISWASTFGEPERGAELVDRVIRLNPDYPSWAIGPFSYAYVMAGRYEDALRVLEHQSADTYNVFSFVYRSVSDAALGHHDEAKTWVTKTLEQHPDLTIEGFVGGPGWSDQERELLVDKMRQAGFPLCAKPAQLKDITIPFRLPECHATVAP